MTGDLIARARDGDEQAFELLVDPHRRELQVHCYRVLGSVQDAEDAVQETLVAAWRGLDGFQGRSSIRTWLYQIATRRCLNALRADSRRRPRRAAAMPAVDLPEPTGHNEVVWLEPYPDLLLEGLPDHAPGPEARYETREAISLAFVTALQLLSPRQRAVLVLRDVLGFPAREAARMLDTTDESVTSALKRARATLRRQRPSPEGVEAPPLPGSVVEQEVVAQLTRAYETGDVGHLVALLTDDVRLVMPPIPLEYRGRDLAVRFHAAVTFQHGRTIRLVATRSNGQPAFGMYAPNPNVPVLHANGLLVLTLAGNRISAMTRFDNTALPRFGLPRTLPEED